MNAPYLFLLGTINYYAHRNVAMHCSQCNVCLHLNRSNNTDALSLYFKNGIGIKKANDEEVRKQVSETELRDNTE